MIKNRIAKRYARALFQLAGESGKVEAYAGELKKVLDVFNADKAVKSGLVNPAVSHGVKAEILAALVDAAKVDKVIANFLSVVLDARKIAVLPEIFAAYAEMADEATGKIRGVASAPVALDAQALNGLSSALTKALGKEVILEAKEDKTLLGGVVARVGNLVFDASVKTQLQRMRETLIKG